MEKRLDFENNFNIQKAFYNKFWPSLSIIIERSFKKYSQLKITFFHYTAVYEYAILKTLIYMKFFRDVKFKLYFLFLAMCLTCIIENNIAIMLGLS